MKKGISLIVLVITIIVMIIIAGAIIISLSQTNVISQAEKARLESNNAEIKSIAALVYASNLYTSTDENGYYKKNSVENIDNAIEAAIKAEFPTDIQYHGEDVVKVEDNYSITFNLPEYTEQ